MLDDQILPEDRPHIPVTLIAIDTGPKAHLTERALIECEKVATYDAIKFLTHDESLKFANKIQKFDGLEGYSNFCIRELHKYVDSSHCLLVQWDGYVLNPKSWLPQFLEFDYIGAPWNGNIVGNGGFSLRSKKLLKAAARFTDAAHPEDNFICRKHRAELERDGIKFAPAMLAKQFSIEAASYHFEANTWTSDGRGWNGQFGFHSYLTPLNGLKNRPLVFHHSGDAGDIIYGLAAVKAMGGGTMFISPDCRYPYPRVPNMTRGMGNEMIDKLAPLIRHQEYVWDCRFTSSMPASTDVDFNAFRDFYRTHRPENFFSLFRLQLLACGVDYPEDQAWLTCDSSVTIPGKPIIVNRTARFHNDKFPWASAIAQNGHRMAFVGLDHEYVEFCKLQPAVKVPWHKTANFLELARVINGSKVFIGNQSSALAIALGLGKNVIVEEWSPGNPNCRFKRKNQINVKNGHFSIPTNWLE
jgi:hypothetical protein